MKRRQTDYVSFLLRLWREPGDQVSGHRTETTAWRASLQEPLDGERLNFNCLEGLFAYLRQKTDAMFDEGAEAGGFQMLCRIDEQSS